MRIINPSFEFADEINAEQMLDKIEKAYRICYMSEPNGNRNAFIANKIKIGHESPLEHASVSVIITTNRGVTHELVRHRIASYSQSSTRYCNFSKDKFGNEITVIRPCYFAEDTENYRIWKASCEAAENAYFAMLDNDATPQEARSVLPNSLKTEICMTANLREWRHFFKLRALGITGKPHPQMLEVTVPLLAEFKALIPVVFDDLIVGENL